MGEATPGPKKPGCVKCRTEVSTTDSLPCGICKRRQHTACCDGVYTKGEINKFNKADTSVLFMCLLCKDKIAKLNFQDVINGAAKLQKSHEDEKKIWMDEKLKAERLEQERSATIKDLQRKIDFQEKLPTTSLNLKAGIRKKKKYDDMSVSSDETASTFRGFGQRKLNSAEKTTIEKQLAFQMEIIQKLEARQDRILKALELGIQPEVKSLDRTVQNLKDANEAHSVPKTVTIIEQPGSQAPTNKTARSGTGSRITPYAASITYAQALAQNRTPIDAIRNIEIVSTDENQKELVADLLRRDNVCADKDIRSIKSKGKYNLTFKCANNEDANAVSEKLQTKYGNSIKVTGVLEKLPQVKITRLISTSKLHNDEILAQIIEQNLWLPKVGLKIEARYQVTTKEGEHDNIILSSNLGTHQQLIKRGAVIFGFSSCKVFEYVNIIQCFRCLRFGHFARECKNGPRCQLCTQNHEKKDCKAEVVISKCVNCTQSNRANGTTFSTRHRSSDERCPVRIQRINGLKTFLLAKNR